MVGAVSGFTDADPLEESVVGATDVVASCADRLDWHPGLAYGSAVLVPRLTMSEAFTLAEVGEHVVKPVGGKEVGHRGAAVVGLFGDVGIEIAQEKGADVAVGESVKGGLDVW